MRMLRYLSIFCICITFFYTQHSQGGIRSSVVTQALLESLDEYGYWTKIRFSDGTELTSGNSAGTQTSQNMNLLPNGVLTFGANSTISLPSLGIVLQLAELGNVADIDNKIPNTSGTMSGNLSILGTLYAERFNHGGTGTVHDSDWTETTNGEHHIDSVGGDIFLDSYVNAEFGIWTDYSKLLDSARARPFLFQEFLATGANNYEPFVGAAISSGAAASVSNSVLDPDHPGVQKLTGSSTANSGYYIRTGAITFLIDNYTGPYLECIYNIQSGTATHRIGFIDNTTSTAPVDGAYLEYNGTMTVVGKAASASVYSTTTTSFTGTVNTWYRSSVTFNTDGGTPTAFFTVYDMDSVVLWTDELNTNIPTGAGRETGAGLISTTAGTSSPDLILIDWMAIKWWGWLTR